MFSQRLIGGTRGYRWRLWPNSTTFIQLKTCVKPGFRPGFQQDRTSGIWPLIHSNMFCILVQIVQMLSLTLLRLLRPTMMPTTILPPRCHHATRAG